ncbi:MAG: hypothetical protein II875_14270 [Clostridia bacterium]|nr:hypothetical protein [Clostridia bacterium]
MKYTSAAANKLLKKLAQEKEYCMDKETNAKTYVAAVDEEPVVPEFDYEKNAAEIERLDEQIVKIKHAISLNNALARIDVNGKTMSVDEILVRMAQLNRRLVDLDEMRKALPKTRVNSMGPRTLKPEYTYINYDIEKVKADYERYSDEVTQMQLALDKYNQTAEFEIE